MSGFETRVDSLGSDLNHMDLGNDLCQTHVVSSLRTLSTKIRHTVTQLGLALNQVTVEQESRDAHLLDVEPGLKTLMTQLSHYTQSLKMLKADFTVGVVYRRWLDKAVDKVCHSVHGLLETLHTMTMANMGNLSTNRIIGQVWETCDGLETLPTNERVVMLQALQGELGLLEDALRELQEDLEEEDKTKEALIGLIKVVTVTLKKAIQTLRKNDFSNNRESNESITTTILDSLVMECEKLSPIVDNLGTLDNEDESEMNIEASELKKCLDIVLNLMEPLDLDKAFVPFLKKALKHNHDKLLTTLNTKSKSVLTSS